MLTNKVYPILIILSTLSLLAQPVLASATTTQTIGVPTTLGEVWTLMGKMVKLFFPAFGDVIKGTMHAWAQMAKGADNLWDHYIWSRIETVWNKLSAVFGGIINERVQIVNQELQKEKKEFQREAQQQVEKTTESIWTRITDFLKSKI